MSVVSKVTDWLLLNVASKVRWKMHGGLTDEDRSKIQELLAKDYYLIATRRKNHLTTYLVSIANFLVTGKFGYWSHVLVNVEDDVQSPDDFRLIEAISAGTTYTPFNEVFNCSAVAILKPKKLSQAEWTAAADNAKTYLGRPYDSLFDLANDNKLSCVELIYDIITKIPGYRVIFSWLVNAIEQEKYLTPQMFYDSEDFEVVYEVRK